MLFGAAIKVERFTFQKLLGVLASLIGVILISRVDLSEQDDSQRGTFPHKSQAEIALGDLMAAFSAVLYGVYTIVMKKRVGGEREVNMPVFFGMVGFWNAVLLWPGFLILHLADVEKFELPPTSRVWTILLVRYWTKKLREVGLIKMIANQDL